MGWKIGTDWNAKKAEAGSKANDTGDRPQAEGTRESTGDLGDGGVCKSPSNRVDDADRDQA